MHTGTSHLTTLLPLIIFLFCSTSCTAPPSPVSDHTKEKGHASIVLNSNATTTEKFAQLRTRGIENHIDLDALEPGEVCVINANETEAEKLDQFAQARYYTKKKRRILTSLGFVMSILQVPSGTTVQQGIATLRQAFPTQIVDANHHYYLQGPTDDNDPRRYGQRLVGWTKQRGHCTTPELSIGMIDTPIDLSRLPIAHQSIHTSSFLSANTTKALTHHGTAIAILLVGHSKSTIHALLPNASLFAAEAFRQTKAGNTEATTWNIVRALDWLVEENVQVINLSLGGPANALLSYAIKTTLSKGISIVAASGNAGLMGSPTYPAAQPGVIAVTALDAQLQPYRHANRGTYIAFSAPGVDIWVPHENGNGVFKSGTSFAAPFVTAAAATIKQSHPHWTPPQITNKLSTTAVDLGIKGKDPTFGWGLIQISPTCQHTSLSIRTQSWNVDPDSELRVSRHVELN
ncbi:MAG: S8 family serine peptidase [Nitrospirales bacterium]